MTTAPNKLRGFAYLQKHNPERLAELAAKGGASVSKDMRSFSRDRDLASTAGRAGGLAHRSSAAR